MYKIYRLMKYVQVEQYFRNSPPGIGCGDNELHLPILNIVRSRSMHVCMCMLSGTISSFIKERSYECTECKITMILRFRVNGL